MLNRGIVFRSFDYPEIAPRLREMGFQYDTIFACLARYLLRPRPAVMEYVNQHASFFALPSVYSVGIQVRAGDLSMASSCSTSLDRKVTVTDCTIMRGRVMINMIY
jgi:hypothetical protein